MSKGLIVYFDGPDGVGKTTQVSLAAETLRVAGREVHEAHILGGSPISDALRDVMLSDLDRSPETSLHIAMACQYASAPDILRRRDAGEIVLFDRSPLSIVAYQVYGDGLGKDKGLAAAEELFDVIKPDAIVVYEASAEVLENRRDAQARHKQADHFGTMPADYHDRTSKGYKETAQIFKASVLDASGSVEKVHAATMGVLNSLREA